RREALSEQQPRRPHAMVRRQGRSHRLGGSQLGGVPESDREPVNAIQSWKDQRTLKVLGMGTAMPGPPVSTEDLLDRVERRFGVSVMRHGRALARRLKIGTRHLCRDLTARHESPRPGHSNADLAAAALAAALEQARLDVSDLAYVIGHTTTPACLLPANIVLVADLLCFAGPSLVLR